jgi:predicted nuclease of restriction endonuclease-like (RecB) superfamily
METTNKSNSMPRKRSQPQLPAQRIAAAAGYASLLQDLKSRIRAAQVRAALSVNRELIELYWSIGRDIVLRQEAEGWGKSIIDHLAADLQHEFPGMAGFSRANIYRMRSFYLAYRTDDPIVSQAARQPGPVIVSQPARQLSGGANLAQAVRQSPPTNLTQAVSDSPANDLGPILPQAVAEIPWFHNVVLIEKIKDPAQTTRAWFRWRIRKQLVSSHSVRGLSRRGHDSRHL